MPLDDRRSGPLICTDHSVRMILRGVKVHSRRAIKRPKDMEGLCDRCWFGAVPHARSQLVDDADVPNVAGAMFGTVPYLRVPWCEHADVGGGRIRSPYGTRGDRLWVRETCRELEDGRFLYRADLDPAEAAERGSWKNVRFVPKRSARTWLEVVDVRPERLQEITPEEVVMEGVCAEDEGVARGVWPRSTFATLWDQINGRRGGGAFSWEANPWVWRLSFRCLETEARAS